MTSQKMDRAAVVEKAIEVEVTEAERFRIYATLAAGELALGAPADVLTHLRDALQAAWLEEAAVTLGSMKFKSDAEATAALECFGKDESVRDAWVRTRLDAFRHAVQAAMPTRLDVLGFGRYTVAPGASWTCSTVAQGWFRPHHLFVSVAGDVAVPCAKCKHEPEGRRLSDLRVAQILIGCMTALGGSRAVPADLFTVHRDLSTPGPDPTYETAGPGITIAVTIDHSEAGRSWSDKREPITFEVAMLGEYIANPNGIIGYGG
jgi:hypothetical protein